ncbi:MAG: DNA translocase FtsK 4TM domain-containing protein [Tidjanibacter sp.]|nr:DNA translocase FtsK 4TM domain-containing protein [Tidjanibacter sp.]
MARKSRNNKIDEPKKRKSVQENDNQISTERWVFSFVLMFVSLLVLLSIVSYYFTWSDDQFYFQNLNTDNAVAFGDFPFANLMGGIGAWLGYNLVTRFVGVFGVCVPVVLLLLAFRIMKYRPLALERSLRITIIVMLLGSLTLGYAFKNNWGVFGSGLGGVCGWQVAVIIEQYINYGEALLLFMAWVLFAVYLNRRTIVVVNSVGDQVAQTAADVFALHRDENEEGADENPEDVYRENTDNESQQKVVRERATVGTRYSAYANTEPEIVVPFDSSDEEDDWRRSLEEENLESDKNYVDLDDDSESNQNQQKTYTGQRYRKADSFGDFQVVGFEEQQDEQHQSENKQGETGVVAETIGAGGVVESVVGEDGMTVIKSEHVDVEADEDDIEANLYDPTKELSKYQRPPLQILENRHDDVEYSTEEINENKEQIKNTLDNFGIKINRIKATVGPTVTLYEIEPAQGVKIARIKSLEDNIALDLKALSIRIIAPIPGKGTVGIEIPNKMRQTVSMYSVVKSLKFQECKYELPIVLGKTIQNETFIIDLAKMPHLLVVGATGQGKSVGLNVIIASLLYKKHPAELKLVMVDPKKVELSMYSKLEKYFLAKMESEDEAILTDTQKVVYTLNSLCVEMEARYELLRKAEVKKITEYNDKFLHRRLNPKKGHRFLPYVVVVIDEFADMIMTAGKEVETPITRLAQLARAVGIHLIIATQRPDVKVITGLIKANFPARIAFRVSSMVDSRTILDQPGANQLVGQGDMLMLMNGDLTRLQCAFIDTPEIDRITAFISKQKSYTSAYALPDYAPEGSGMGGSGGIEIEKFDPEFKEVARFVVGNQIGSTSAIQRNFSYGYNKAGRLMDQLEKAGIVGRQEGSKPREILVYDMSVLEDIFANLGL